MSETEYQRGLKVGMAVMQSYIADYLKETLHAHMYSAFVRKLPPPKYPTEGTGVLECEPIEISLPEESGRVTIQL